MDRKRRNDNDAVSATYRVIFQQAREGMALLNRQGEWIDANRKFEELLGLSRDGLFKTKLHEVPGFGVLMLDQLKPAEGTDALANFSPAHIQYVNPSGKSSLFLASLEWVSQPELDINHWLLRLEEAGSTHRIEKEVRSVFGKFPYPLCVSDQFGHNAQRELLLARNALAAASNGILITDSTQPDNPIMFANRAFLEMCGYDESDILGRSCRFLQNDDRDQPGLPELRHAIETKTATQVVLRNYKKDGTLFYNQLHVSPVKDEDGAVRHFIGIASDVTQALAREESLRIRELQLTQILENVPAIVFQWYYRSVDDQGFDYINARSEMIYDTSVECLLKDWHNLPLHPEDVEKLNASIAEAVETGNEWHCEYRLLLKSGQIRWMRGRAVPTKSTPEELVHTGVVFDITQEHEAQEQRRADEERFRLLIASVSDAFFGADQQGCIVEWNAQAEHLFGWTRDEVLGKQVAELIFAPASQEELRELHQQYATATASQMNGKRIEVTLVSKDRHTFPAEIGIGVIRHRDMNYVYGFVHDISSRKLAEQTLQEARAQLEQGVQERTRELVAANNLLTDEIRRRRQSEVKLRHAQSMLIRAQAIAKLGSWKSALKEGTAEWSPELFQILGVDPASFSPSTNPGLQFIHADDRARVAGILNSAAEHGNDFSLECRLVRADQAVRYIRCQGEVLRNEIGEKVELMGVVQDITDSKLAEQALRQSEAQLRDFVAHQDRIKEQERVRIARDIHDELGGLLTGIKSFLSIGIEKMRQRGRSENLHLIEADEMVDRAMETIRRIITDLRPSVLDQLGLWTALEWYVAQVQASTDLRCSFSIENSLAAMPEPDGDCATAIFRIVQEALTNVTRHAHASSVTIWCTFQENDIIIEITDNGIGIQPASLANGRSWGIVGMYERARQFGGDLNIVGTPGQGTVLILRLPKESCHD